jgi:hypothetical protein
VNNLKKIYTKDKINKPRKAYPLFFFPFKIKNRLKTANNEIVKAIIINHTWTIPGKPYKYSRKFSHLIGILRLLPQAIGCFL